MSDLAPFVAANLKDKVVADLLKENEKLREDLRRSRSVEMTGPEGNPVYFRGHFDEDGSYHGNPNLWDVKLPEKHEKMPLANLIDAEIRVGGFVRKVFDSEDHEFTSSLFPDDEHTPQTKVLHFYFPPDNYVTCSISVSDWPEEHFLSLQNEERESGMPGDFIDYEMLERLAEEIPEATIEVAEVAFGIKEAKGALKDLPQFNNEEDLKRIEADRRRNEMYGVVGGILDATGRGGGVEHHFRRIVCIVDTLERMGITEPGERFDAVIDEVIDFVIQALGEDEEG